MNSLRKVDALIAEHIFGWGPIENDHNGNPCGLNPEHPGPYRCHIVPNYTQDMGLAIAALERTGNLWGVCKTPEGGYAVSMGAMYERYTCPAPEAICWFLVQWIGWKKESPGEPGLSKETLETP